jgi:N-glycosylase/DNA lyase
MSAAAKEPAGAGRRPPHPRTRIATVAPAPFTVTTPPWHEAWQRLGCEYEALARPPLASEPALRQELVFCLLGGHGVSFELARSATDVVMALCPFEPGWQQADLAAEIGAELAASKFDPRRKNGSLRRYRYPARKAELLAAAVAWVRANGPLAERLRELGGESERREWVCGCPGIGPKSASWFLRNTGGAQDLAILDVHIVRAMRAAGRLGEARLPRDYAAVEARFRVWCEELGASVAALDLFLWEWQRGDLASTA